MSETSLMCAMTYVVYNMYIQNILQFNFSTLSS